MNNEINKESLPYSAWVLFENEVKYILCTFSEHGDVTRCEDSESMYGYNIKDIITIDEPEPPAKYLAEYYNKKAKEVKIQIESLEKRLEEGKKKLNEYLKKNV